MPPPLLQHVRPLGGILFCTLRDAYGVVQLTIESGTTAAHPAAAARGHSHPAERTHSCPGRMHAVSALRAADLLADAAVASLKLESVVQVNGSVRERPVHLRNPDMATGDIEVVVHSIQVLTAPSAPLPLQSWVTPEQAARVSEDVRLTFRYLDIRRSQLQRNLRLRSAVTHAVRNYLHHVSPPFVEVRSSLPPAVYAQLRSCDAPLHT
ncbi:hypothetical protein EON67_08800 [archaeon]|nr:MAG: hypothetical protein EON67_08800 [archaeon]